MHCNTSRADPTLGRAAPSRRPPRGPLAARAARNPTDGRVRVGMRAARHGVREMRRPCAASASPCEDSPGRRGPIDGSGPVSMGIPRRDGVPNGIRTRVSALKGLDPRPLDDGDAAGRIVPPPDGPSETGLARRHETSQYTPPDLPAQSPRARGARSHAGARRTDGATSSRTPARRAEGRQGDRRRSGEPRILLLSSWTVVAVSTLRRAGASRRGRLELRIPRSCRRGRGPAPPQRRRRRASPHRTTPSRAGHRRQPARHLERALATPAPGRNPCRS